MDHALFPQFLVQCAGGLYRAGDFLEAQTCLEQALKLPTSVDEIRTDLAARDMLEACKLALVDRWHFSMLNDFNRNDAFRRAILAFAPGKAVLDVGTGSGLLSLYACEAEAAAVIACDASITMIKLAKQVFHGSPLTATVRLVHKLSTHMTPAADFGGQRHRARLLITETFDCGLLGEHVLETLDHAWKNLLVKDGARVIPAKAEMWVCLVTSPELERQRRFAENNIGNLNSTTIDARVSNDADSEPYDSVSLRKVKHETISEVKSLFKINFENPSEVEQYLRQNTDLPLTLTSTGSVPLTGVALWFDLDLLGDGSVMLSTSPYEDESVASCWEQAIFYVDNKAVERGEKIDLKFCLKEHVSLQDIRCRTKSETPAARVEVKLPSHVIKEMHETQFDFNGVIQRLNLKGDILDLSSSALIGMHALRMNPATKLSRIDEDNFEFVRLLSWENGFEDRVAATELEEIRDQLDKFNLVVTDVLDEDGRLCQNSLLLLPHLPPSALVLPATATVSVQPLQAGDSLLEEALAASRVRDGDASTHGHKIGDVVNEYAANFIPARFLRTKSSTRIDVASVPTDSLFGSNFTVKHKVKLDAKAQIRAVQLDFLLDYGGQDSSLRQCGVFFLPEPLVVEQQAWIEISVLFHDGMIFLEAQETNANE